MTRTELYEKRLSECAVWTTFKEKWYGKEPRRNSKAYVEYETERDLAVAAADQIFRETIIKPRVSERAATGGAK